MPEKQLNDFEATVVLRKAMSMNKIIIDDDENYQALLNAKNERDQTKYLFLCGAAVSSIGILYLNYRTRRFPWYKAYMKSTAICGVWGFMYWTSPGQRKYNEALIQISKNKRHELMHAFDP